MIFLVNKCLMLHLFRVTTSHNPHFLSVSPFIFSFGWKGTLCYSIMILEWSPSACTAYRIISQRNSTQTSMWSFKQVQRIWSTLLNYSLGTSFLVIIALTLHIQLCIHSTSSINYCTNLCLCYICIGCHIWRILLSQILYFFRPVWILTKVIRLIDICADWGFQRLPEASSIRRRTLNQ